MERGEPITRPHVDNRDPLPPQPWEPTSHEWARRQAKEATEAAVRRAKDQRKKPAEETTP